MSSATQAFADLGNIQAPREEGSGNQFPKLPPESEFDLEIVHCEVVGDEQQDCGVCMVIEHKILKSSTPQAAPGQMFTTTITHLTGEYKDLKSKKVRNFLGAAFGQNENDATQPWSEIAVYACTKDAAKGKRVHAVTSQHRSKNKGRPYLQVDFSPVQ